MRYFLSAGEASGDVHASHLIAAIKRHDKEAEFEFLGGDLMASAAGKEPVIHYRHMAYMGFSEVLRHLREILGNFGTAKRALTRFNPDALVLVDYPSFNLKLAEYARKHNIAVYYFIVPKVWAWKEWRVKALRRNVKKLLSILPFEVAYFRRHNVDVEYVGNPSVEEVDSRLSRMEPLTVFRTRHNLDDRPILAIVPGSRKGEIRNNLPVMEGVARLHPELQAMVAAAPGIDANFYSDYTSLPVINSSTLELMHAAEVALVTSGTATLECALAGTPQVACYRANGKKLSYSIMRRVIKLDYVTLPNLIADKKVIPEMLVHQCTVENVNAELEKILPGKEGRAQQLHGYEIVREKLGTEHAADNAARILCGSLLGHD